MNSGTYKEKYVFVHHASSFLLTVYRGCDTNNQHQSKGVRHEKENAGASQNHHRVPNARIEGGNREHVL
jgi:hypothetical protein